MHRRLMTIWICVVCLIAAATSSCSDPGDFDDQDAGVTNDAESDTTTDTDDGTTETDTDDAEPDASSCTQTCAEPTPYCDETSGECAGCLEDSQCSTASPRCHPDTNTCVECVDDSQCSGVCDTSAGECVECVSHGDCTEAGASQCDSQNTCQACTEDAHCAGVEGKGVCDVDSGACIECTEEDNSACDGGVNACDPATNTCTEVALKSVQTCGACKSDTQCADGHRCVPMEFDGQQLPDGFCLMVRPASGCPHRPYQVTLEKPSLSGHPAESYCGIDESLMSCQAVLDQVNVSDCSSDNECGAASVDDGTCDTFRDTCTYACTGDAQCAGACFEGYCVNSQGD